LLLSNVDVLLGRQCPLLLFQHISGVLWAWSQVRLGLWFVSSCCVAAVGGTCSCNEGTRSCDQGSGDFEIGCGVSKLGTRAAGSMLIPLDIFWHACGTCLCWSIAGNADYASILSHAGSLSHILMCAGQMPCHAMLCCAAVGLEACRGSWVRHRAQEPAQEVAGVPCEKGAIRYARDRRHSKVGCICAYVSTCSSTSALVYIIC
jgi:hypothetical protein